MFFTITMRFSTFRDSFCGESIMFLEINLVHNSLNNVIKNLVKIFSLKSNTFACSRKNQILSLQEHSLAFLQTITSSFV